VGNHMINDFYLPDATLSVVFDPLTSEYRMILLSGCKSTCVCMRCKLSAGSISLYYIYGHLVLASSDGFTQNSTSNNKYPTHFVKIGWDTTTIIERSTRLTSLLPASHESKSPFFIFRDENERILTNTLFSSTASSSNFARGDRGALIAWFVSSPFQGGKDVETGRVFGDGGRHKSACSDRGTERNDSR
jgi:hypothetical protein